MEFGELLCWWRFGETGELKEGMTALCTYLTPYSMHLFHLAVLSYILYDKLIIY